MLTRAEADQIAKEAVEQGWAEEVNGDYDHDKGVVRLYDWDEVDRQRREIGNEPLGATGCSVELTFPGMYSTDRYYITETDDWRKLKSKVDELREILKQAGQRGWKVWPFGPKKHGKFSMYIEVSVPGMLNNPQRVGGMRTWRKLCREADATIQQNVVKELRRTNA